MDYSAVKKEIKSALTEEAFNKLFQAHWEMVYKICYFHVKEEEVAADLAQNVFAMVWTKRDFLINDGRISHYLARSAKLEALQYKRSKMIQDEKIYSLGQNSSSFNRNFTEEQLMFREAMANVEKHLNTLPPKSQQIYRLNQIHGLTKEDIARDMAIPKKTVEHHLYYVIKFLKTKLFKC